MRIVLSVTLLVFMLAGCVAPPAYRDSAFLQGDLAQVKKSQKELFKQMEQIQNNLLLVEARVKDQQELIEALRDTLRARPAGEKTVTKLELPEIKAPAQQPGEQVSVQDEKDSRAAEIYLRAFADYASGRFEQAVEGFESFLKLYPHSDYAVNAQYWLGECFYSQQLFSRSIKEFKKVVELYPQASKVPDALWKMASALNQTNDKEQAMEILHVLRVRYPDSSAAKKTLDSD